MHGLAPPPFRTPASLLSPSVLLDGKTAQEHVGTHKRTLYTRDANETLKGVGPEANHGNEFLRDLHARVRGCLCFRVLVLVLTLDAIYVCVC